MNGDGAVGVFDSGLGGLSVAREVRALLPSESILYVADTAYCPYGDRTDEEIQARSLAICHHLVELGAKVIVVACNTASGAALELLREKLPVPVIGTEPAVKPAVAASRNRRVGVLATSSTVRSARFRRLIERYAGDASVLAQACPGLADMVEQGTMRGPLVRERLRDLLAPLRDARVDTVVLGCTHYPFLADEVREVMGPEVRLVDSGAAIARQTERVLRRCGLLALGAPGPLRLLTTGDRGAVSLVAERLWAGPLQVESDGAGQLRSSGAAGAGGSAR